MLFFLPMREPIVYRFQECRAVASNEALKLCHVCGGNLESGYGPLKGHLRRAVN
jgi:hypothetical protein